MIDFAAIGRRELTIADATANLTTVQLAEETERLYNQVSQLIAECDDAAVIFQPVDERADDPFASDAGDKDLAWTLGHVIVHITASAEESAALGAELARGIPPHGRSRYETPWETVTTIAACHDRLAEIRRMCLASLQMWPDAPHYDLIVEAWPNGPTVDARGRYLLGLTHLFSHLGQIGEIVGQARAAR